MRDSILSSIKPFWKMIGQGILYVNREQDLGEEGLRKAKESYFPHHMINKYTITLA